MILCSAPTFSLFSDFLFHLLFCIHFFLLFSHDSFICSGPSVAHITVFLSFDMTLVFKEWKQDAKAITLSDRLPCSQFQVCPATQRGGVLFAITDARQKVVELGLALTPVRDGLQSILLYYTDREQASHSHKAAAFSVPDMTDQWTRFTVSVTTYRAYCI